MHGHQVVVAGHTAGIPVREGVAVLFNEGVFFGNNAGDDGVEVEPIAEGAAQEEHAMHQAVVGTGYLGRVQGQNRTAACGQHLPVLPCYGDIRPPRLLVFFIAKGQVVRGDTRRLWGAGAG